MFSCVLDDHLLLVSKYDFEYLERDSPRDQLVVTLFVLTVLGLLLSAGIKNRMLKAGIDTNVSWDAGRRWWEVSLLRSMRL
jgi:hypothetical protein